MARKPISLEQAIAALATLYPLEEPLTDPVSILVWENVGYLIDDDKRRVLFAEFAATIGLTARQIAHAPLGRLTAITSRGGMSAQDRAARLKEIGRLVMDECDGDLPGAIRSLPLAKARTLLKRFPSVGDPGADRILLFSGAAATPCVDSNGLRALVRLGFVSEEKSYAQTYRGAVAMLAAQGRADGAWLRRAWFLLRAHGKALCKRSAPICEPCPLDASCAHRMTARL